MSPRHYWKQSFVAYIGVLGVGMGFAWMISGISVLEAKSLVWIYIVYTFGYLVFIAIVSMLRKLMGIALEQDARLRGELEEEMNQKR